MSKRKSGAQAARSPSNGDSGILVRDIILDAFEVENLALTS
jgi:hypothetical protein